MRCFSILLWRGAATRSHGLPGIELNSFNHTHELHVKTYEKRPWVCLKPPSRKMSKNLKAHLETEQKQPTDFMFLQIIRHQDWKKTHAWKRFKIQKVQDLRLQFPSFLNRLKTPTVWKMYIIIIISPSYTSLMKSFKKKKKAQPWSSLSRASNLHGPTVSSHESSLLISWNSSHEACLVRADPPTISRLDFLNACEPPLITCCLALLKAQSVLISTRMMSTISPGECMKYPPSSSTDMKASLVEISPSDGTIWSWDDVRIWNEWICLAGIFPHGWDMRAHTCTKRICLSDFSRGVRGWCFWFFWPTEDANVKHTNV